MIDKIIKLCNNILLHRSKLSTDKTFSYSPLTLNYSTSFCLTTKDIVRISNNSTDKSTDVFQTRHGYLFSIHSCYPSERTCTISSGEIIYRLEYINDGIQLVLKEGMKDIIVHSNITEDDVFALGVLYDSDVINMLYCLFTKLPMGIMVYYDYLNEHVLDEINEKYDEVLNAL